MLEGIRIILSHATAGSHTCVSAPEGLFEMQYILSRSAKFHGMNLQISGNLGFCKADKTFVDSVIDTYGIYTNLTLQFLVRNPETLIYEEFTSGLLNIPKHTKEVNYTYCFFENTDFKTKINNRSSIKVPYNRTKSIENETISAITYDYANILCQGIADNIVTRGIYPFELFWSIIKQITDIDYPVLTSTILGKTINERLPSVFYTENGELAFRMLSKGIYLRGWDETKSEVTLSLDDVFNCFDKQIPLGLGFDLDSNGREIVVIEDREYFYQNLIAVELDKNRIKDLKIEISDEYTFNELEFGYAKTVKKDNTYGLSEYNNKSTYSVPISMINNKLSIINSFRADGIGINDIITNFQKTGATDTKESEYDEEMFIIDSMESIGNFEGTDYVLKNKKNESFDSVSGIYQDPQLWYNLDISPARILIQKYGKWLNIGLQELTGLLKFNKAENLSILHTLKTGDTIAIDDCTDIDLSVFDTPIMTGRIFRLSYPFTIEEIKDIKTNFYGQISFWNHIEHCQSGGWIKEISTKPVDKETNITIYECVTLAELLGLSLNEDGGFVLNEDTTFVIEE